MTVEVFIYERYWPKLKPSYSAQWQRHTEHLLKLIVGGFGRHHLTDVPLEDVDEWWGSMLRRFRTPVTANKALVRAKHVFKTAIRWKLCTENPFNDIRKKREQAPTFTPLSDAEHARLYDDASPALQGYLIFARYTGARLSSLAKLEERDIDLEKETLTFRETKNGADYTVPIHPTLKDWCVRAVTGDSHRRVLHGYATNHAISSLFRRLKQRNKVSFRFHDYRHNLGTKLAEKGHSLKTIMDLLGHKDPRMSIRYTHISMDFKAKALGESV